MPWIKVKQGYNDIIVDNKYSNAKYKYGCQWLFDMKTMTPILLLAFKEWVSTEGSVYTCVCPSEDIVELPIRDETDSSGSHYDSSSTNAVSQ